MKNLLRHLQHLMVPTLIILLIGLGWYFVIQQNQTLTQTTITAYQQTQLEIVRTLARSVDAYVSDQVEAHAQTDITPLEQEIFKRFIAPVRLLQNGDAWIYAPDHIVFDLSSDFPAEYRGKSMAQIFALQAQAGASHYEEMTTAVSNAREGVGWYIWLPDKGQEIAAWTPVKAEQFVWTIGMSTPLPEILESTGAAAQIRNAIALMTLATALSLGLLWVWLRSAIQRGRAEAALQQYKTHLEEQVAARTAELVKANIELQQEIVERQRVEQALRKSEALLDAIVNNSTASIYVLDAQGRFLLINNHFADIFGLDKNAVIGKTDYDIFPPDTAEAFQSADLAILQAGVPVQVEEFITLEEGLHTFLTLKFPLYDATGTPYALCGLSTDITERQKTEQALREREELFRALFESSPDAVMLIDPISRTILDCNKTACIINGYSKEELIGQDIHLLDAVDPHGEDIAYLDRVRAAGVMRLETLHRRKDGAIFPLEVSTTIITLQDREILLGIDRDISARKQAEEALRKSEERLRSFINTFPDIAFIMDEHGLYIDVLVSENTTRFSGAVELLKGRNIHEIFSPEISQLCITTIHQTIESGQPQLVEYILQDPTGPTWYEGRTFPMRPGAGESRTILWLAREVTERRQAEEAIRKSTEQLATINEIGQLITSQLHLDAVLDTLARNTANLLEADTGAILLLDEATQTLTIKKAYGLSDYIVQNTRDRLGESIAGRVALNGQPLIVNDLPHDPVFQNPAAADEGLLACASVPLRVGDKMIGTLDIHSKRPSRTFNEEDIYLLQLLADQAAIAIANARLFNEEQRQRQIAESLRQVSIALNGSLDQKTVLDKIFEQLEKVIQYDGAGLFLREGDNLILSAGRNLPAHFIGTYLSLTNLNPTLEPYKNKHPFIVADVYQHPHWHTWPDGERIRAWMGAPLLIQDKVIGVLTTDNFTPHSYTEEDAQILQIFANQAAIAINNARLYTSAQQEIAERKQAQEALAQARDQALAASRLKTELLAKVSHELRTPLGAIMGFAEMIETEVYGPISADQKQPLVEIIDSTKFLNSLVNELLDQAQLESGKLKLNISSFTLHSLIEEMLAKMNILAQAKGLALTATIAPELPSTLSGDATRLQQILINLVSNAIKFTKEGAVKVALFQPRASHWAIRVTDTGIGIPAQAQAHIFEPFGQVDGSMTRESQGTGLGLSIVKQLVHLMGGEIKLESDGVPGRGSNFTVILPYRPEVA